MYRFTETNRSSNGTITLKVSKNRFNTVKEAICFIRMKISSLPAIVPVEERNDELGFVIICDDDTFYHIVDGKGQYYRATEGYKNSYTCGHNRYNDNDYRAFAVEAY